MNPLMKNPWVEKNPGPAQSLGSWVEAGPEPIGIRSWKLLRHVRELVGPGPAQDPGLIVGLGTAVVVGPSGEEIYGDKYGRVKVQFFWDRSGNTDGDGLPSAWESGRSIDLNCNGVITGGGVNFDPKRKYGYKYAVFGHFVTVGTPYTWTVHGKVKPAYRAMPTGDPSSAPCLWCPNADSGEPANDVNDVNL